MRGAIPKQRAQQNINNSHMNRTNCKSTKFSKHFSLCEWKHLETCSHVEAAFRLQFIIDLFTVTYRKNYKKEKHSTWPEPPEGWGRLPILIRKCIVILPILILITILYLCSVFKALPEKESSSQNLKALESTNTSSGGMSSTTTMRTAKSLPIFCHRLKMHIFKLLT